MHAPVELMFIVLVSSINSVPALSLPRTNTGTCRRIRGDTRRRASAPCPLLGISTSIRISVRGTPELVRGCRFYATIPLPICNRNPLTLLVFMGAVNGQKIPAARTGKQIPFRKWASGTLLPLTARTSFGTMSSAPGKGKYFPCRFGVISVHNGKPSLPFVRAGQPSLFTGSRYRLTGCCR